MTDKPDSLTTERARPKIVIFDDRGTLLKALTDKFTKLGYEVVPVYVSDGQFDTLIENGRFRRGVAKAVTLDDWRAQDEPVKHPRTLDIAYADAAEKVKNGHGRYRTDVLMLEGILSLPEDVRIVTNEKEVEALLSELNPDCVLSDYEMRRSGDKSATNRLMGDDVMRVAHETVPQAVRVLHSSLYTFFDQKDFEDGMELAGEKNDSFRGDYEDALREAAERGYLIASKDINPMGQASHSAEHTLVLDRYLRQALRDGKPPSIVMGNAQQR